MLWILLHASCCTFLVAMKLVVRGPVRQRWQVLCVCAMLREGAELVAIHWPSLCLHTCASTTSATSMQKATVAIDSPTQRPQPTPVYRVIAYWHHRFMHNHDHLFLGNGIENGGKNYNTEAINETKHSSVVTLL